MVEILTHLSSGTLDESSSIVFVIEHTSLADLITMQHLLKYRGDLERRQGRGV